jgi:two-component system chemotaxis sensor kinase CheA
MTLDLSSAIATFLSESKELLQEMEDGLIELESELDEYHRGEVINAVFRAIHTIKGSAGIFGFDHVVSLTHIVETTLDALRLNQITLDKDLISAYLSSKDLVETLVELAVEEIEPDDNTKKQVNELIASLSNYINDENEEGRILESQSADIEAVESNSKWHLIFVPNENVLRNGLDPFAFLYFLSNEVENLHIDTFVASLEQTHTFDPESNYFSFHAVFDSDKSSDEIAEVFEFIQTEANISILPPNSSYQDIFSALGHFPDSDSVVSMIEKSQSLPSNYIDSLKSGSSELITGDDTSPSNTDNQTKQNQQKIHQSKTLRVEALKLDRLIDQVGEMVITGARTNLLAHETGNETLIEAMSLLERLVENIRDSSLKLRMVQIGETFNKFKRVVRDIAQELGKEVELSIEGAETELDKTFVEKVSDPLMHIVRNAIDHGIESPDVRKQNGKDAAGKLTLRAYHDSGSIVIEIKDDGQGLNKERILDRAIERGIITSDQTLADKEINLLIFEPGFSTAEAVTNISGRGVGMDVVKRNIESLRGSVEVESKQGLGSLISIRLPLTLSIIDGFMFSVHDANYVIPLDTVVECLELHELVSEEDIQDKNYINLRTEVLPFIRLRSLFGITEKIDHSRESLVIVQFGTLRAGLVVDSLKGEFQTVVKPLGRLFEGLKCISGATILGSGNVAIILDVSALIKSAISVYESLEIKQ